MQVLLRRSTAERSHNVSLDALSLAWSVLIGSLLFFYTWLGTERFFPPIQIVVQLLVVTVLSGWWAWKVWRREGLILSPMALPVAALLGSSALSTLYSADQRRSLDGLLYHAALVLLFFLLCDVLWRRRSAQLLIDAILVFTTLLLVQSCWVASSWYASWYSLRVPEYPLFLLPYRLFGVADWPTYVAAAINLALPFAIVKCYHASTLTSRGLWVAWLLVADLVLFLTRARGATIGTTLLIGIMIGWLCWRTYRLAPHRNPLWTTRRIWGATIFYVAIFTALHFVSTVASPSEFNTHGGGLTAGRFDFWEVAFQVAREYPLLGGGPRTYGRFYVNMMEATRLWMAPNAHSLYVDTLAQQGVLGVACLVWMLVAAARTLGRAIVRHWRANKLTSPDVMIVVAVAAGGGAYLTHSVFETVSMPTNAIVIVAFAASGMHAAGSFRLSTQALPRWTAFALLLAIPVGGTLFRQHHASSAMLLSVSAGAAGNWHLASQQIAKATFADPQFVFYEAQRGYANAAMAGAAAEKAHTAGLVQASTSYADAVRRGPHHVPDLLNAAAVFDQLGQDPEADAALEAAAAHGSDWALPSLMLGERYALRGERAKAEQLFMVGLKRELHATDMAICQRNEACRELARSLPPPTDRLSQVHREAAAHQVQNRPAAAIAVLQSIDVRDRDPLIWLDRALAHLALGELNQARYTVEIAKVIGARSPQYSSFASLVEARLALARHDSQAATAALEFAARPNVYHIGYSLGVFRRISMPGPLVPQVDLLQRTAVDLEILKLLAILYHDQGRTSDAAWANQRAAALDAMLHGR